MHYHTTNVEAKITRLAKNYDLFSRWHENDQNCIFHADINITLTFL